MAQNENPSGVTWLGWQQFILWRWSFSFKEICTEFGSRKADVPWTFMILGELGHQLNRSGKGFCHCFFQSYSTPCPLDFKNGRELFSLFPIYPYSTETLHSYLVPLAAFTLQSLLWPRHSQTVLYFLFVLLWISSSHPKGQRTQSAASSGTLSRSSHHKAVWILKLWLINNAFQQNINPFPPISYNYSLK